MTKLLEVLGQHLPAVERDLIVAGLHFYDLGTTKLSWVELESFVLMAPPGSATHTSRTGSWNEGSQMLAAAQLAQLHGKPPPGGVRNQPTHLENMRGKRFPQQAPADNPNRTTRSMLSGATAIPLNEFKERMEKRHREWAEAALKEREAAKAEAARPAEPEEA